MTGYMHPDYAESLSQFGEPHRLPRSGGWILVRRIPGFPCRDAMGTYPLFFCHDWSKLHLDLEDLADDLVSLAVVADPFGDHGTDCLLKCFKDVVVPYKEHLVIDLRSSISTFVCNHHRRYARKALRNLYVERCDEPEQFVKTWGHLYANLIKTRNVKGIQAFSRTSFAKQFSVPGMVVFRAAHEQETIGMLLCYVQGEVSYYHLGAYSSAGYNLHASFALFWFAIEYFANKRLRWLNLGAGAGVGNHTTDGLSRFKRGWSTGTETAYFCGRIFDHARYSEIERVSLNS